MATLWDPGFLILPTPATFSSHNVLSWMMAFRRFGCNFLSNFICIFICSGLGKLICIQQCTPWIIKHSRIKVGNIIIGFTLCGNVWLSYRFFPDPHEIANFMTSVGYTTESRVTTNSSRPFLSPERGHRTSSDILLMELQQFKSFNSISIQLSQFNSI